MRGNEEKLIELKPCPFCGGEAFIEEHKFHGCSNTYGVKCSKCHTQTYQFFDTKEMAEKRWNTRTPKERGGEK